jgi:uncharacterized protein YqgQ
MKKTLLLAALSRLLSQHGNTLFKKIGQKGVSSLSGMAYKRGILDRTYDLETLTQELQSMYHKGRFTKIEWTEISARLKELWKRRRL